MTQETQAVCGACRTEFETGPMSLSTHTPDGGIMFVGMVTHFVLLTCPRCRGELAQPATGGPMQPDPPKLPAPPLIDMTGYRKTHSWDDDPHHV